MCLRPALHVEARQPAQRSAPTMSDDELLTVEQAADILKIGRTKVYELISGGELRTVTIGRCRRIRRSDLQAYIAQLAEVAHA
jgi:excisionase family DNA binding protein